MANPNLVNVTSIYANSINGDLTTTVTTDLLTCASDKVIKVNSIIIANVDGTNSATVTMGIICFYYCCSSRCYSCSYR